MNLETLIEAHGYWVLALGCFLEGETILVLAGFAAHRGYLNPLAVLAIAALAGFLGDQLYFWLGRRHGNAVLGRWPSLGTKAERIHRLIERYHVAAIIGIRFAYGFRVAGPVLIGMSPIPGWQFSLLNAVGAILWACLIAGVGWVFGHAAEIALGEIHHIEGWLLLGLAVVGVVVWLIRRGRASRP